MAPFSSDRAVLHTDDRRLLLGVARRSIAHGLAHGAPLPVDPHDYPPALRTPRATFVTLHLDGELRGCIGTLQAVRLLISDVAHNAFAAAFRDPRFSPVMPEESEGFEVHIEILQPPEELNVASEADLRDALRPGVDGLIFEEGGKHRATFLPSVWAQLPDPAAFILHLKHKAGFRPDYWSPEIRVQRYVTESFGDEDVVPA